MLEIPFYTTSTSAITVIDFKTNCTNLYGILNSIWVGHASCFTGANHLATPSIIIVLLYNSQSLLQRISGKNCPYDQIKFTIDDFRKTRTLFFYSVSKTEYFKHYSVDIKNRQILEIPFYTTSTSAITVIDFKTNYTNLYGILNSIWVDYASCFTGADHLATPSIIIVLLYNSQSLLQRISGKNCTYDQIKFTIDDFRKTRTLFFYSVSKT